jgi:hypothetical protein
MRYTTQNELYDAVTSRIRTAEPRYRAAIARLTPAQVAWNPPEGGWSIAQVFEHLCVTDEAQFPQWERVIRSPNAARKTSRDAPWAPRLAGKFVVKGLLGERKTKSPPKFQIGDTARPNVTETLVGYIDRVLALIEESTPLEWRRVKLGSAALPILRYNLGDTWLIEAVHLERHAGQIERVLNHASFPKT